MLSTRIMKEENVIVNNDLHVCTEGHYIIVNVDKIVNPSTRVEYNTYEAKYNERVYLKFIPIKTSFYESCNLYLSYDATLSGISAPPLSIVGLRTEEHPNFLYFPVTCQVCNHQFNAGLGLLHATVSRVEY